MTEPARSTTSRWIDVAAFDGQRFGAWLALPPVAPDSPKKPSPGIVVLQEIWGVNAHIRAVAEQYAADGYVALAPDLFWRTQPRVDLRYDEADTRQAYGYRKALDVELADRDIASTVDALRALEGVAGGIAAIGYCLGGLLAYRAAAKAGIDCAVCYYGGGISQQLDLAPSIAVPMAFHFAERDAHIPAEQVDAIKAALADRDDVRIDTYADADHGFNCWARPSYHQRSAALAHGRSLAFLSTHLAS